MPSPKSTKKWPTLGELPQPGDFNPESALKPFVPGIYCLWSGKNVLVYIGQSANISARLATHRREGKKVFLKATFWPITSYSNRLRYESILILAAQPTYNRAVTVGLGRTGQCWDTTRGHFGAFKARPSRKAKKKSGRGAG